jgi:CheY-like chemotaxis protein
MTIKRALIVDDSKSARFALKRMLDALNFEVDTVESANDALNYLEHHQPDVIFMDHMMPGMDGFEAVKRIKGNPQTVVIPIMMYTSKGGDLYLSQARALGAVGIIPKTIAPVELKESLLELGLIDDAQIQSTLKIDAPSANKNKAIGKPPQIENTLDKYLADLRKLMDEQTIELHRSMWLGIESVSHEIFNRLNSELKEKLDKIRPTNTTANKPLAHTYKVVWPVYIVGALLILSIFLNVRLFSDMSQLENQLAIVNQKPVILYTESQAENSVNNDLQAHQKASLKFSQWALSKTIEYPYDELALNDNRLASIEDLLNRALQAKFTGRIILQTHVGEFCLSSDQEGNYKLADNNLPVSDCEYIGNYIQPSDKPSTHQSLSFANYLADTDLLHQQGIVLEVRNMARKLALSSYPRKNAQTTAQKWNRAAQRNNLISITLEPSHKELY